MEHGESEVEKHPRSPQVHVDSICDLPELYFRRIQAKTSAANPILNFSYISVISFILRSLLCNHHSPSHLC
ncbi:hypothetical protein H5410_053805 [Solanum commersonii]|uniref:Uncharacterized protein n=1 Tax=Solanum commersonii TaxID=4109 RepID=A0A9J5X5K5_SOLCO|nr:hypothetical protein H5410_053805 [Solanum commersonii]